MIIKVDGKTYSVEDHIIILEFQGDDLKHLASLPKAVKTTAMYNKEKYTDAQVVEHINEMKHGNG